MKQALRITLFAVGGFGLLLGCKGETVTNTPTVTPSQTVTGTAFDPEFLARENLNRGTIVAATPSIPPASRTPRPPSFPTAPPGLAAFPRVYLTPSPDELVSLLRLSQDENSFASALYAQDRSDEAEFYWDDADWLRHVMLVKSELHFPDGFPDPSILLDPELGQSYGVITPDDVLSSLSVIVLKDIESRNTPIQDGGAIGTAQYAAYFHRLELDRDPDPEWLIEIAWKDISVLTWLVLDESSDRTYRRLLSDLPVERGITENLYETDLLTTDDFTGDGLSDVLFLRFDYAMGTDWGDFYILQGGPSGLKQVDQVSQAISGYLGNGLDYEIAQGGSSSSFALKVRDPHDLNWGCSWQSTRTYRWPNGKRVLREANAAPPSTADCFLARAVTVSNPPGPSEAISLLRRAVASLNANDTDQAPKLLFARFRLAVMYGLAGQEAAARDEFRRFLNGYTGSANFAENDLASLLDEEHFSALRLCGLMTDALYSELPEAWFDYLTATAAVNAYPYWPELYPPAICPMRQYLETALRSLVVNPAISPQPKLIQSRLPVQMVLAYPPSDRGDPTWFALVGARSSYLAGYVPHGISHEWVLMYHFDQFVRPPEVFTEDTTGDGVPELAVFGQTDPYGYLPCESNEDTYEVFLITATIDRYVGIADTACWPEGEHFDIMSELKDANHDGLVDWVVDATTSESETPLLTTEREGPLAWFSESEVQNMVLPSADLNDVDQALDLLKSDPATFREQIEKQRSTADRSDSLGHRLWARLTYLEGLSYEVEGNQDQALLWYSELLRDGCSCPWLYLSSLSFEQK